MPKHGGLRSAGKRQESATFLQRSFFNVALQFFACCSAALGQNDFRIAEQRIMLRMLQCNFCSAAFRKLQRNFRFRLCQGPLNGGVSNGGASRSGLVLPFLSLFVLSGIFPIWSGMVRGFSRFVPFLFLGLLQAPMRNSPERPPRQLWHVAGVGFRGVGFSLRLPECRNPRRFLDATKETKSIPFLALSGARF